MIGSELGGLMRSGGRGQNLARNGIDEILQNPL